MRNASMPNELLDFQLLGLVFEGVVEDIRSTDLPAVYDPASLTAGQSLGSQVRSRGGDGVAYSSLRRLGGQCLAGFRPNAFHSCRTLKFMQFYWDGTQQRLHAPGIPPC
jgi:hypothetical protein